jgi:hypothetical protein
MTKKASTPTEGLRVVGLTVENLKRIRAVHIVPEGDLIQLTGKNGAGKSTVLDSIWWALKGKAVVDPEPIRTGEERATIRLDLGALIVTRVFNRTEDGDFTTSLKVESAEGALFPSPQKLLDDLLGSLTFDPLAFLEKDAKGQVSDLAKLVKLEVDLDLLDGQNAADYENRKDLNRRVKELAGKVGALRSQLVDIPLELIDTSALVQRMAGASKINQEIENGRRAIEDQKRAIADKREKATQRRERAAQLIREAEQLEFEADAGEEQLANPASLGEPVDTTALLEEIQKADAENQKRKAAKEIRDRFEEAERNYQAEADKADALTQRMAARTQQKADAIAAAKMPVDGLGFGNGIVTFNAHPLSQASTGEQWTVALAIAGAMNPKLKVIMIRQGALMDSDRIRQTAEWAAAKGYQVWMERVEESGKVGIVMHDGEATVAGASE